MKALVASTVLAFLFTFPMRAAEMPAPADDPVARIAAAEKLAKGLKFQQGQIVLKGGVAKISLPDGFRYLDPANTEIVLRKLWGNPGGSDTLGMITPAAFDPLGDDRAGRSCSPSTRTVTSRTTTRQRSTTPTCSKQMQEDTREASKERAKQGYSAIELVGWAAAAALRRGHPQAVLGEGN